MTVQLPVYNEPYVIERLLQQITAMEYVENRWEIQVLDDSTDETSQKIRDLLPKLPTTVPVYHIQRGTRGGYKAGALAAGMLSAKGTVFAIFDADFLPDKDFLCKTVPYLLQDPKVGFVQTRWGYTNERQTLYTRVAAFAIDGHFFIEQVARFDNGYYANFNGTAGIWRKACIVDAGGWQADTLTEDWDISFRAQLRGWRHQYLCHIMCPSELPENVAALKQQQYRWSKGGAQTARKHFVAILRAPTPVLKKFYALLHISASHCYLFAGLSFLLSLPLLYVRAYHPEIATLFKYMFPFQIGCICLSIFYACSSYKRHKTIVKSARHFIRHIIPCFMLFSGLSLVNGYAVISAWLGIKSSFMRTPKQGKSKIKRYATRVSRFMLTAEGLLVLYCAVAIGYGIHVHIYGMIPFHLLIAAGYSTICWSGTRT